MEDTTSAIDPALVAKLRALAARGAILKPSPEGGGVVLRPNGEVRCTFAAQDIELARSRYWIAAEPGDSGDMALTKRGLSAVRRFLSTPASTSVEWDRPISPAAPEAAPSPASRAPAINHCESPLAWLRTRHDKDGKPFITATEFEAGERLRADFHQAQLMPRITSSWDATQTASRRTRGAPTDHLEITERALAARQRLERALAAVQPGMADALVDICCLLLGMEQAERNQGWPKRCGKVMIGYALEQLAIHYGLLKPGDSTRRRIRHWGLPDYRPAAEIETSRCVDDHGDDPGNERVNAPDHEAGD